MRRGSHATFGVALWVATCLAAACTQSGASSDGEDGGDAGASDAGASSGVLDATTGGSTGGSSSSAPSSSGSATGSSSGGDTGAESGGSVGEAGSQGPPPPSCQAAGPGRTNCGAGSESCCTSLPVQGGTYHRTFINDGGAPAMEADPATISTFRLDKYLVTVGRFRQFVAALGNGWTPPPGSGKHTHLNGGRGLVGTDVEAGISYEPGWIASDDTYVAPTTANLVTNCNDMSNATWTATAGSQENLPINCVDWYEAEAFCIWDDGFLPSEAEWEYAATGGAEERLFPWGSTWPGTACPGTGCEYLIYDCYYPSGPQPVIDSGPLQGFAPCPGLPDIAPVGTATLGAGRWGQLDLAGEVNEWLYDWRPYSTPGPAYLPWANPCTDCANVTESDSTNPYRAMRGGEFMESYDTSPLDRQFVMPDSRAWPDGFRCARAP